MTPTINEAGQPANQPCATPQATHPQLRPTPSIGLQDFTQDLHSTNPSTPPSAPMGSILATCPECSPLELDDLEVDPALCHRDEIRHNRITRLEQLHKRGLPLPPLVVLQKADGRQLLLDGLHRLILARKLGIRKWPALIFREPTTALAYAIRQNAVPDRPRKDRNARRAALVLSNAVGRALGPEELADLGLDHGSVESSAADHPIAELGLPESFEFALHSAPLPNREARRREKFGSRHRGSQLRRPG